MFFKMQVKNPDERETLLGKRRKRKAAMGGFLCNPEEESPHDGQEVALQGRAVEAGRRG